MSIPKPLELMGAPGSPYTRKMLALLRFRRIPYQVEWQSAGHIAKNRPVPRVPLLPTFYLPDDSGNTVAVTDSTPLLRTFEKEFEGRSVIPTDPVLAYLNYLLEDYADEWLTKAMFHYRWHYEDDIKKAGKILPRWRAISAPDSEVEEMTKYVCERQISRLSYVGSNDVTKPLIESSFKQTMSLLDAHLTNQPFLFGHRPSSADFAFYGQLTCLAAFDPTPSEIVLDSTPRILAWTEVMEDFSGLEVQEQDWLSLSELTQAQSTLTALLHEVKRIYYPYLQANAQAVQEGKDQVDVTIDGYQWVQNPFPYQEKCLRRLQEEFSALTEQEQSAVKELF